MQNLDEKNVAPDKRRRVRQHHRTSPGPLARDSSCHADLSRLMTAFRNIVSGSQTIRDWI